MPKSKNFYSIQYWPAWLIIGIWRLLIKLPYRCQLHLGKIFGLLLFVFDKKSRKIAKKNIELCFKELNKKEQRQLLRQNFISMGIAIFETGLAWYGTDRQLKKLAHIHGNKKLKTGKTRCFFIRTTFTNIRNCRKTLCA